MKKKAIKQTAGFKTWKKVVRMVLLVLLALVLGMEFYLFNARVMLREQLPTIGGVGLSVIISGSMEPSICVNDVIVVQEQEDYGISDVVVYVDADLHNLCTHRIVDVDNDGNFITKGDANNANDKPISKDSIQGKVIAVVPQLGWLLSDTAKFIAIIVLILLLILSFWSEAKSRKADKEKTKSLRDQINAIKALREAAKNSQVAHGKNIIVVQKSIVNQKINTNKYYFRP